MNNLYRSVRTGEIKSAQEWIDDMGGYEFAINPAVGGNNYDDNLRLSLFENGLVPA